MLQTTLSMTPGFEPMPGYVLRERIGMGGFGEVWSVTAPGGLDKAIKLVHGTMDSERANRELRSLERLRRVHHPFLLTLERYEIVDNHLMIVTERADEGLDQIVARYQSRGLPGIPREELLQYLIEAADALDHLREKYGLQHLDIKPANLLVLSGHMKVADFGLVKDLRDIDQSIVGGLTPTYAAPEVFDGRPSIHSDQYSLAIVFQELLTGQRPFSGKTIAQLATQHVHSAPELGSLPFIDRPVIARALEKNPERRFANCMELIRRLLETGSKPHAIPKTSGPCAAAGDTCLGDPSLRGVKAPVADASIPVRLTKDGIAVKSALIIGIGGVGAEVAAKIQGSAGLSSELDLRYLLLDTDAENLESVCSTSDAGRRLNHDQTLHLPLRTAHDYRESAGGRLATVSRRWIYNVPRSGKTEGLRPVGRLALADHAELVIERLRNELKSLPQSADAQVLVVASLVGGTGGGMAWDIIHLVRALLDEAGHAEVSVVPLLAVAWPGSRHSGSLQLASTHASLTEGNHFANPINSYPGDSGAGFPPVPAARSPLHQAILFVPEGNQRAADLLVEFMQLSLGLAGPVLRAAVASGLETKTSVTTRTIKTLPCSLPGLPGFDRWMREASYRVVRQILGNPNRDSNSCIGWVEQVLCQQDYVPQAWNAKWLSARRLPASADLGSVLEQRIQQLKNELPVAQQSGQFFLNHVDRMVLDLESQASGCCDFDDAARLELNLVAELNRAVKSAQFDLSTLIEATEFLVQRLETLSRTQGEAATKFRDAAGQISQQLRASPDAQDQLSRQRDWAHQQLMAASATQSQAVWQVTADRCKEVARRFAEQIRAVANLAAFIRARQKTASEGETQSRSLSIAASHAEAFRAAMADFNSRMRNYFIGGEWIDDPVQSWALWEREAVEAFARVGLVSPNHELIGKFAQDLPKLLAETRPQLLDCGGLQRRLLVVGDDDQLQLLQPMFREVIGESLAVSIVPGVSPVYLHIGLEIPSAELTSRLITALGPDHQLVGKLHARGDIRW